MIFKLAEPNKFVSACGSYRLEVSGVYNPTWDLHYNTDWLGQFKSRTAANRAADEHSQRRVVAAKAT